MRALIVLLGAALCACGGPPTPPSKLVGPSKRCMVPPESVHPLGVGDDLVAAHGVLIRQYGRETSKVRCLQRWASAVTRK